MDERCTGNIKNKSRPILWSSTIEMSHPYINQYHYLQHIYYTFIHKRAMTFQLTTL